MLKNSRTPLSEKIAKDVWTKADEHVVKIEKECCKENCIDRFYKLLGSFFVLIFHIILVWYQ
jgi:hypothetical protein